MITETLALKDGVSGPAAKMADAVDGVSKATARAEAGLGKLGNCASKTQKAMGRESATAKAASASTLKLGKSAKAAGGEIGELSSKKLLGAFAGPTIGMGILGIAIGVTAVGQAAMGAAKFAASLVAEFAHGVVEAKLLRDKAQAMQDVLSGGRGAQVLKLLHTQAIRTGQSFDDLAKATQKSREAGLDYKEAFKLNALRGDLKAVTGSAEVADAEIGKALDAVKSGSKTASQAMAELAKKYKVAGDGSKAYEVSSKTLGGALERLKEAAGNVFAKVAEKAGPALDKLGGKLSKLLDDFNESGTAASMVDKLAGAMEWLADAVGVAAALIKPLWTGFKEGLGPLGTELTKIGEMIGKAFGGDKKGAMDGLAVAAQMVGRALGFVVGVAVRLAVGFAGIVAGGAMLVGWFMTLPARAEAAAQGLISGLVNGIRDGIGRAVQAAKELADKVKSAVADALKLKSPSKVFAELGRFTSEGMAIGIEQGTPAVAAAGRELAVAPMAAAASASPAGGGTARAGGSGGVTINLSVAANPGATQADGHALASGIVPVIRREIANWLEDQMASAGMNGAGPGLSTGAQGVAALGPS